MHELEAQILTSDDVPSETKVRLEPGQSASDVAIHINAGLSWTLSRGALNEARDQAPTPVVEGGFSVEWPVEPCDPGWVTITQLAGAQAWIKLRADELARYMQDTVDAALGSFALGMQTMAMELSQLLGEP